MDGVVWIGRTKVPFRCVPSQRVKQTKLEIHGPDVIVIYPQYFVFSLRAAEELIYRKRCWVIENLEGNQNKNLPRTSTLPVIKSGMTLRHFGREKLIEVTEGKYDEVNEQTSVCLDETS